MGLPEEARSTTEGRGALDRRPFVGNGAASDSPPAAFDDHSVKFGHHAAAIRSSATSRRGSSVKFAGGRFCSMSTMLYGDRQRHHGFLIVSLCLYTSTTVGLSKARLSRLTDKSDKLDFAP